MIDGHDGATSDSAGPGSGAVERYRVLARKYDSASKPAGRHRERAVDLLGLRTGQTVVDVGCGTGASLRFLVARVGPTGRVIGVDVSPEMLDRARARVDARGWDNVELRCAAAETIELPRVDAALFLLVHDVLQSDDALTNVLGAVRPGGTVVAAGAKWAPWWAVPLNGYLWWKVRRYRNSFAGYREPWQHLEARLGSLAVMSTMHGLGYVASGHPREARDS